MLQPLQKVANLRDLVVTCSDRDYYKANEANILFELNHLELHGLDDYLFQMWRKKIVVVHNKGNSNVAYLIGLTRFIGPGPCITEGGTSPDIDVDFMDIHRDAVKDYLKVKYGTDRVSNIGTFNISKCKGIFKDVSRIFGLGFDESNSISKLLSDDPEASLAEEVAENKEIQKLIASREDLKKIFDYACKLEGSIRSISVHASGYAITDIPISEIVPLFESKGEAVTQFDHKTLEKIGIVKFDLLGLKNLTVIDKTVKLIKKNHGKDIDIDRINLSDKSVYDLFERGDLLGVFQVEGSSALMNFAAKSKPKTIEDISAIIALYRPGPMGMGALDLYLKAKNKTNNQFEIPEFSHIFDSTYGLLVYQEQLMRLSREMCGFTDIEADELRKAVGKKDRELLLKQKNKFVEGAVTTSGQSRERISALFDSMEEFARYCFNLSHSICYAYIAFQTAWLKANYPKEYMASIISCEKEVDQKSLYIENARKNGIKVLPPNINQSEIDFTTGNDESILFGFNSIKGLGDKASEKILSIRPFSTFEDFLIKAHHAKGINKKSIEALINCGALDCFGYKRSVMISGFTSFIFDYVNGLGDTPEIRDEAHVKKMMDNASRYFDNSINEFSFLDILENEKMLLGIYLSGNPFNFIKKNIKLKMPVVTLSQIPAMVKQKITGIQASVLCRINLVKPTTTKDKKQMAFVEVFDANQDTASIVAFAETYKKLEDRLKPNTYVVCKVFARPRSRSATPEDLGSISYSLNDIIDLSEEVKDNLKKTEAKNSIKSINVVFETLPPVTKVKSVLAILEDFIDPEGHLVVNVKIKLSENKFINLKQYKVRKIDIDLLRAFSKIKDVYVIRSDSWDA